MDWNITCNDIRRSLFTFKKAVAIYCIIFIEIDLPNPTMRRVERPLANIIFYRLNSGVNFFFGNLISVLHLFKAEHFHAVCKEFYIICSNIILGNQ